MRVFSPLLVAALFSCSPGPGARTARTTHEPPPVTVETVAPPDAGPRPAKQLYQRGKPYTPSEPGDDRYTCRGTPAGEEACRAVRPGHHCVLESPVGYWEGPIRCKGTKVTDWEREERRERLDSLGIPACVCGCTDDYIQAADAFDRRRDACDGVR